MKTDRSAFLVQGKRKEGKVAKRRRRRRRWWTDM